jgi:hypothetical protein
MTDKLLLFEPNSGDVLLTDQAKQMVCFQNLDKADTTKAKSLFKNQLKVLFYFYSSESIYIQRYTPAQRKEMIFKDMVSLSEKKIDTEEFRSCERTVARHTLSREQAQFLQIQKDWDRFLDYLNSIPWDKEVVEKIKTGKKETIKTYLVSNMEERMKAVKVSKDILSLQKELEAIVAGKKGSVEENTRIHLFEDPESIVLANGRNTV